MLGNNGIGEFGAALAQSARPAAVFADVGGYIRFWNVGAENSFGHSASRALGQRVDLIVPDSLREAHWTGFHKALASSSWRGSQDWGTVPALHRNGEHITLEVFLLSIQQENGGFAGVLALFRNPA
ncbi:MAG TPA: PAS domain S-box protein [Methylocella sp.]|nr:PAS domain S-box protein [Methylocella sp.]